MLSAFENWSKFENNKKNFHTHVVNNITNKLVRNSVESDHCTYLIHKYKLSGITNLTVLTKDFGLFFAGRVTSANHFGREENSNFDRKSRKLKQVFLTKHVFEK